MNNPPKKCLVDTNVPKTANLAIDPSSVPDEFLACVLACIAAVNGGYKTLTKPILVSAIGGDRN